MAIHLSGLPGERPFSGDRTSSPSPTLGLAPGGVYRAGGVAPAAGALLPHPFTLTCAGPRPAIGGLLSVALSCGSPRLAVSQHPALRSPDLPRHGPAERPVPRPPGRLTVTASRATTWHVPVTAQRIGRVSAMSGGPRQLFDPEAPPRWPPPGVIRARVRPGRRRGPAGRSLSIGGLYDEVEGALTQAFPREPAAVGARRDPASLGPPLGPSLPRTWSIPTRIRAAGAPGAAAACRP